MKSLLHLRNRTKNLTPGSGLREARAFRVSLEDESNFTFFAGSLSWCTLRDTVVEYRSLAAFAHRVVTGPYGPLLYDEYHSDGTTGVHYAGTD